MAVDLQPMTAEQLLRLPRGSERYELVRGELQRMSPASYLHGKVAMRIAVQLASFVEANALGDVCAAEPGFLLRTNPDTVRAPDVAFVSHESLARLPDAETGYFPGAPDLAIEVTSPSDRDAQIHAKVIEWLDAGTAAVVVLDLTERTAEVHRRGVAADRFEGGARLTVPEVLPDWSVRLDDVFGSTPPAC